MEPQNLKSAKIIQQMHQTQRIMKNEKMSTHFFIRDINEWMKWAETEMGDGGIKVSLSQNK